MDRQKSTALTLGVEQQAQGVFTDQFVESLDAAESITLVGMEDVSAETAKPAIASGEVDAVVVVPPAFEEQIEDGTTARLRILIDSSNPLTGPAVQALVMGAIIETAGLLSDDNTDYVEPFAVDLIDVVGSVDRRPSVAFFAAGTGGALFDAVNNKPGWHDAGRTR